MTYSITLPWEHQLSDARIETMITGLGLTRTGEIVKEGRVVKVTIAETLTPPALEQVRQAVTAEVLASLVTVEKA
jgi:metal-sulfur cluster biosynthetic enzyme